MSDFFLWFCEKGPCNKGTREPQSEPAQPGTQAGTAAAVVPLGSQLCRVERKSPTRVSKGSTAPGLKKSPERDPVAQSARKDESPTWKRLRFREKLEARQVTRPEDMAAGKPRHPVGSVHKGLAGRVPQTPNFSKKQLAKSSKAAKGGKPEWPLQVPHVNAKGDQPGLVAAKVSPSARKRGAAVPRRTRKPPPQVCAAKGAELAVARGDMDVKWKGNRNLARTKPPTLVELKPGDLIEIFRFAYQHWAIYVGNGYVIHLAPPSECAGAGCASLMSTLTDKALVKKELLQEVAGANSFRVNNKHDDKYRPLPITKIVQRAEEMVGRELLYRVTSENCEHFVTELRYGVPRSDQVRDAIVYGASAVAAVGIGVLGFLGAMIVRKKHQSQKENQ